MTSYVSSDPPCCFNQRPSIIWFVNKLCIGVWTCVSECVCGGASANLLKKQTLLIPRRSLLPQMCPWRRATLTDDWGVCVFKKLCVCVCLCVCVKVKCVKCWWIIGDPLDGIKPKTQQQLNTSTAQTQRVQSLEQLHLWMVLVGLPAQSGRVRILISVWQALNFNISIFYLKLCEDWYQLFPPHVAMVSVRHTIFYLRGKLANLYFHPVAFQSDQAGLISEWWTEIIYIQVHLNCRI